MLPVKSREHRMRVLEHQASLAAESDAKGKRTVSQLRMPLLVEVKADASVKKPGRRVRRKHPAGQTEIADL